MSRHASAEDLASLDLDALKPRKAARIRTHVSTCVRCTQLSSQVAAVPVTLASVSYPSMPSTLSAQLDASLASESARRLASAPATEAGRRDLPARRHARKPRAGWQLPGMSVIGTRLVAAAGAVVVVGFGGYEIAAHAGSNVNGTAASSTGSAAAPGARQVSGPTVQYGQGSSSQTVHTVHAATNFTPANLGAEALAAVHTAKLEGLAGVHTGAGTAPNATASSAKGSATSSQAQTQASLASCLDGIVGNQPVQLVETAKFEGNPATIIVTTQTRTRSAEVWVVRPACSGSPSDVLAHLRLSRT